MSNCETHDLPANRDGECELCRLQPDRLRDPFRTMDPEEEEDRFFTFRDERFIPYYRHLRRYT